jgi:hypothetical protein
VALVRRPERRLTAPPRPSTGRRIAGLVIFLVLFALLAYPIGVTGLFAYAGFTGCFISCSAPEPGTGLLWSAVAAVLLALPLALGMATAGVRSPAAWWSASALVLLAVAGRDLVAVLA